MLHTELSHLAVGLPPSILAAAVGRAARLAGISVTDLLGVDAAHEKAGVVIAALEKVQAQYGRKKAASRDRRSNARKAAPAVRPSVASLSQATSQISIVGAECLPPPPPPTPSPPPSPPAKAPPRPSRASGGSPHAPRPPGRWATKLVEAFEEEEESSEESEDEESSEEEEPPSPPPRPLSRAPSRPTPPPKKAGSATRARWGL